MWYSNGGFELGFGAAEDDEGVRDLFLHGASIETHETGDGADLGIGS